MEKGECMNCLKIIEDGREIFCKECEEEIIADEWFFGEEYYQTWDDEAWETFEERLEEDICKNCGKPRTVTGGLYLRTGRLLCRECEKVEEIWFRNQNVGIRGEFSKCELCEQKQECFERNVVAGHHCILWEDCWKGGSYFTSGVSDHHTHMLCRDCCSDWDIKENQREERRSEQQKVDKEFMEENKKIISNYQQLSFLKADMKEQEEMMKENRNITIGK